MRTPQPAAASSPSPSRYPFKEGRNASPHFLDAKSRQHLKVPGRAGERSPLLTSERGHRDSTSSSVSRRSKDAIVTRSSFFLMLLTIAIGGLQIAWSVELSNGSPYLLSLGMSKSFLALVWIAGPISGTLVQPYIGILSDNCRISWGKRKPFMLAGGAATIISLVCLAWTREIVKTVLGKTNPHLPGVTIAFAVLMVYILDFSINTVQAGIRAFIVDNAPPHQQDVANAWASRMSGAGNVLGYLSGYVNLPRYLPFFGNTQFKVLCVIACIALSSTLAISCLTVQERDPREEGPVDPSKSKFLGFFAQVFSSIRRLPPQIRKVCDAQFFAWIGWFPFLFYSTTYIGEIYVEPIYLHNPPQTRQETDKIWEAATRCGTFALLVFAVVSLAANTILPLFIVPSVSNPNSPIKNRLSFLQIPGLTIRRIWILSHGIFALAMFSTFFVTTVWGATAVVAACGIPWAITLWAPFALLSTEISKRDALKRGLMRDESPQRVPSVSTLRENEEYEDQAGIILGLHNVSIAAPQIIATVLSSFLFKLLQKPRGEQGDTSLAWVMRFGGVCACAAIFMTMRLAEDNEDGIVFVDSSDDEV